MHTYHIDEVFKEEPFSEIALAAECTFHKGIQACVQSAGFVGERHFRLAQPLTPGCSASNTSVFWLFSQLAKNE